MNTLISNESESSRFSKFLAVLLLGSLSMFFAEVLSGSSLIWYLDYWGVLVTFPLYLTHSLFYLNIGFRIKKTSISDLYLYGILFALYEAPITKVLWIGYPGSEGPALGLLFGVSIYEYIVLVLFWHPIMSFVLPILIFETMIINNEEKREGNILPTHYKILTDKTNKTWITAAIYFSVFFLPISANFDFITLILAFFGSILIILGLMKLYFKSTKNPKIYDLKLTARGFFFLIIYLIIFYIFFSALISPESFPQTFNGYYFILGTIIFVLILLKIPIIKKKNISIKKSDQGMKKDLDIEITEEPKDIPKKGVSYVKLWLIFLFVDIILIFIPEISFLIGNLAFLGTFFVGIGIFIVFLVKRIKRIKE